mmetsp:Transcript_101501/g.293722  ORF Transcript_101501/g.293722 Transcript_101501/m.293722 type:complete len:330 (-) Transcript_101501:810-1799(-)
MVSPADAGEECVGTLGLAYPAQVLLARLGMRRREEMWEAYLPQKLRPGSTSSPDASDTGMAAIRLEGRIWVLSQQAQGCRWVQGALQGASTEEERIALAQELRSHVVEASMHQHANHVLQQCIETITPEALDFVVDEIVAASATLVARHKYGCRVVQRLVERCPPTQIRPIVESILEDIGGFSCNPYGTHVVQNLLQHGTPDDRRRLVRFVAGNFASLCAVPHGCSAAATAMAWMSPEERHDCFEALLAEPRRLPAMALSRPGASLVVRAFDELSLQQCRLMAAAFAEGAQVLDASPHGRWVLDCLQRFVEDRLCSAAGRASASKPPKS